MALKAKISLSITAASFGFKAVVNQFSSRVMEICLDERISDV